MFRLCWEDERYVRVFTRDTADYLLMSFEAQSLYMHLRRKAERTTGCIQLGRHGKKAVSVVIGHPTRWDILGPALEELLTDGCVRLEGDRLYVVDFVESEESGASAKLRQQKHREQLKGREAPSQNVTECHGSSQPVTGGHGSSQPVTPSFLPSIQPSLLPSVSDEHVAVATEGEPPSAPEEEAEPDEEAQRGPTEGEFDQYVARYARAFGANAPEVTPAVRKSFNALRRKHSLEEMLRAVDQLASDEHVRRTWTLKGVCSDAGMDRGSRDSSKKASSELPTSVVW
jgi:hypothetical protein